jgi:hypothetical protein
MTSSKMVVHARGLQLDIKEKFEPTLRMAIFVQKLRDSGSREHARRIRLAKKIADIANSVIAHEARTANSLSFSDPAHLSWQQIADALEISKNAAYTRYGIKR